LRCGIRRLGKKTLSRVYRVERGGRRVGERVGERRERETGRETEREREREREEVPGYFIIIQCHGLLIQPSRVGSHSQEKRINSFCDLVNSYKFQHLSALFLETESQHEFWW
jgi:hypothetical protein